MEEVLFPSSGGIHCYKGNKKIGNAAVGMNFGLDVG
jgi:hypothetical protein